VRKDHPLRAMRTMVDEVLRALSPQFDRMYAREGRPSIAPEKLSATLHQPESRLTGVGHDDQTTAPWFVVLPGSFLQSGYRTGCVDSNQDLHDPAFT
jgi:hypothetical protein